MYFTKQFLRLKGLQVTTDKEIIELNNNPNKFKAILSAADPGFLRGKGIANHKEGR